MSLYNQLFGVYPFAKHLVHCLMLGSKQYPVGRIRDVYLKKLESDLIIVLFTRNGGANRGEYREVFEILKTHPLYLRDYDDEFDNTYAYIEFRVPEVLKIVVQEMIEIAPEERGCSLFKDLERRMSNPQSKDDVFVKKAMEVGKKIFEAIEKKF